MQAFFAQLDEVVEAVAALGDVEERQQDPAELDLDVAALGDLERAPHRVFVAGEVERHLFRRLEVEVVGLELPVVRVLERVARLDAEERLVRARVGVAEVVDVAGGDGRQLQLLRKLDELRQDARLHLEVRVLQLDVDVVPPERLVSRSSSASASVARLSSSALQTRPLRQPDRAIRPLRVLLEELPVDARLVVVALEVAERGELDQVRVALVVGGEQREVGVPLLVGETVVRDVDLAPDDRLDPGVARALPELHGARHRAVVGEADGRHLELRGPLDEAVDPAGAVENRVFGVDVEVDEVGLAHARKGQSTPGS